MTQSDTSDSYRRPTSAQETGMRLTDGHYILEIVIRVADSGSLLGQQAWSLSVDTDARGQAVLNAFERAKEAAEKELYGPFWGDVEDEWSEDE